MSEPKDRAGQPVRGKYSRQGEARQARLAIALRTNLAKRKRQAQARADGSSDDQAATKPDSDAEG